MAGDTAHRRESPGAGAGDAGGGIGKILENGSTFDLPSTGTQLPADEYQRFEDAETGASVHRLSQSEGPNHGLFFLTSSFRPNHADQIAFVTHRAGFAQLCLFDLAQGCATVLTDRPDVHAFSPAFSVDGSRLYFTTRAGSICSVEPDTLATHEHARLEGAGLGECALSSDGRWLVSAFKREGRHGLVLLDLDRETSDVILEGEMKLLHPQFQPADPQRIIVAGDPAPRLWTLRRDGTGLECLYENTPNEFIVHESFLGRTDDLIFAVWPYRLARMNVHERRMRTILEINAWHMASDASGEVIVSDTARPDRGLLLIDPATGARETLCQPGASCQGTQWDKDHPAGPEVWAALREQTAGDLSWMEMKADHVYGPQSTHPHPAFDHAARRVSFTSDRTGSPELYVVEAAPFIDRLKTRVRQHPGTGAGATNAD